MQGPGECYGFCAQSGKIAGEQVASLTVSLTKNQKAAKQAKDVDHTGTEIIKFWSLKSLKVSN